MIDIKIKVGDVVIVNGRLISAKPDSNNEDCDFDGVSEERLEHG